MFVFVTQEPVEINIGQTDALNVDVFTQGNTFSNQAYFLEDFSKSGYLKKYAAIELPFLDIIHHLPDGYF